jgi:hypothetical protein
MRVISGAASWGRGRGYLTPFPLSRVRHFRKHLRLPLLVITDQERRFAPPPPISNSLCQLSCPEAADTYLPPINPVRDQMPPPAPCSYPPPPCRFIRAQLHDVIQCISTTLAYVSAAATQITPHPPSCVCHIDLAWSILKVLLISTFCSSPYAASLRAFLPTPHQHHPPLTCSLSSPPLSFAH